MSPQTIIQSLAQNKLVFQALLEGLAEEQFRWKPNPDHWCLLEVICHLYDEEKEDFRTRTRSVLEDPTMPLPPFNPVYWVQERKYIEQNFQNKLQDFLSEREQSIQWLKGLKNPSWENTYQHSKLGEMSAFLFLSNWLAHDYLHIRQINRLKYGYLKEKSGMDLGYAGNW